MIQGTNVVESEYPRDVAVPAPAPGASSWRPHAPSRGTVRPESQTIVYSVEAEERESDIRLGVKRVGIINEEGRAGPRRRRLILALARLSGG